MTVNKDTIHKLKYEHLNVIQKKLHEKLPDLRQRYGVKLLGIFGSYIHGIQTRRNDLDLLVEFEEQASLTLVGFVSLERELATYLNQRVDLVERYTLKPAIGNRILAEVVPA